MKKVHVQRSSMGEGPSSCSPEVKNEKVLMDIVLDDAEDPVADTNTAIFERALRKYCRSFQFPFQELPNHLEHCCFEIKMKVDFVLTFPPYYDRQEFGRQASDFDPFGEDDIAEMVNICGVYLKPHGHAPISCFPIQFFRG